MAALFVVEPDFPGVCLDFVLAEQARRRALVLPAGHERDARAQRELAPRGEGVTGRTPMSEYCRQRISELREMGYEVTVLAEDVESDVVLVVLWTGDDLDESRTLKKTAPGQRSLPVRGRAKTIQGLEGEMAVAPRMLPRRLLALR
jgi:hypothetical protein